MCGLVGVAAASVSEDVRKAFNDMLYLDVLRGEHSTGVAAISKPFEEGTEVEIFKSIGSATEFFDEHSLYSGKNRTLTNKNVGIYIGHNRFATQGKINTDNAHPFEFDNVVGAHNGTVLKSSLRDFQGYADFEVDSQIIYAHLSYTQDIKEVWKDADGAMALVWWDKVNKTLNIVRNNQRPLYVYYTEDDSAVLWASESWMVQVAAYRNNLKLHPVMEVKPNVHYTFTKREDGKMQHTEENLPPFVAKTYTSMYGNSHMHYPRGWEDWDEDYYGTNKTDKPPKKSEIPANPSMLKNTAIILTEYHDVPVNPQLIGYTTDGTMVRVLVPLTVAKQVKNAVQSRDKTKGYYIAAKIFRSHIQPTDFWTNWRELQYIRLRKDGQVVENADGTYSIKPSFLKANDRKQDYAKWYGDGNYLLRGAWENRTQCGCANCNKIPQWEGDKDDLTWIDEDYFFCSECTTVPHVLNILRDCEQVKRA